MNKEVGPVIALRGLRKEFELVKKKGLLRRETTTIVAVDNLDLTVQPGEALAFIGPNGAGKSTTIKMLTGILHPTAGTAQVAGLVPWERRQELALHVGSVFGQKSQLWMHLPPLDSFNLLARIYELDWDAYQRRKNELAELFELQELLDVPVRRLSLGQRMRCEIAASLLHNPRILFLDEPTIGLDPVVKATIREMIRRANKEEGVTVFLTSHDAGDIEQLCKRVVIVGGGRLVLDSSVSQVRREYLRKKMVDVKLNQPFAGLELPGVEVVKAKGFGAKLAVDTQVVGIDTVLQALLAAGGFVDLSIEDPPMEEIIATIYRQRGREGATGL